MGLFNLIFESVINEIRSEDAYARFYNSIPKDVYDAITGGQENIDKFIQFFLNCVRDKKSSADEAIEAINGFKEADQLVKNKVKNKISAGEYEDALDVVADIKYLSSGGAVLSRKKFAKEGYIKLGENERWLCTCTTNYCANNHYYGDSHWCTASDRMGRYDGFHYFKSYSVNSDCALIQYKWKGSVYSNNESDEVDKTLLDPENGFTGQAIPKQYSEFQVQVDLDGEVKQLCDFADISQYTETLQKFIGRDMFNILNDTEKLSFCIKKTKEQSEIEDKYQDAIYESLMKKKEKRQRELDAKVGRLRVECEQLNNAKKEAIKGEWQQLAEKISQNDIELLTKMWQRDIVKRGYDMSEERLAETFHAQLTRRREVGKNKNFVQVVPIFGNKKRVGFTYLSNGFEDAVIEDEYRSSKPFDAGMLLVVETDETGEAITKVTSKYGPYDSNLYVFPIDWLGPFENDSFFDISTEDYEVRFIYDTRTDYTFSIDFEPTVSKIGNNKYVFVSNNEDDEENGGNFRKYLVYDRTTGKASTLGDGVKCYRIYYSSGICFIKDDWGYQIVYSPTYNLNGVKIKDTGILEELSGCSDGDDEDKVYMSFIRDDGKPPVNMYSISEGDFVFGISGNDVWEEKNGDCVLRYKTKNKTYYNRVSAGKAYNLMRLVRKADGTFVKYPDRDPREAVPCDKYGRTEKDLIGDRNLKAWQDAGGYSPEQKSQMDAMWSDRQAKDSDGSEAMKAWNDLDTRRDLDAQKAGTGVKLDSTMKEKLKDPRWKDIAGLKDPEAFMKYIYGQGPAPRANLFYRIGTDGKPIDQQWYDEDEVPAKFSDDSLNEAVNKIKSLFDRMGLLED